MLLFAAALQAATGLAPLTVDLTCRGSGQASRSTKVPGKDKVETRREPFNGIARLRLRGDTAQAQVPAQMRGAYAPDWADISNLKVTEDAITGKIKLALLYAPVFTVNRSTGELVIDGSMSHYSGSCDASDPTARKF